MAGPWERNWSAPQDASLPASASPDRPTSGAAPWERNWDAATASGVETPTGPDGRPIPRLTVTPRLTESRPGEPDSPKTTLSDASLEGYLTGAGAGFRDEVYAASKASGLPEWMGGFRAPIGAARLAVERYQGEPGEASKTYDTAVEEIRARQKALEADHPIAFGGSRVVGSFVPGSMLLKKIGLGTTLGGAVIRSGFANGVFGAVEGAGDANGDLTDRAIGAGKGAPVGTLLGMAAPVAGHYIGKGIGAFLNRGGPESAGAGKVLSALEREGIAPADLQSRLSAAGPHAMIADLGSNLTQQAATIAATPGRGQRIVRGAIDARNAGASDRVTGAVDTAMGGRVNYGQIERDILQRRQAAADPLYKLAYKTPLPPIPEVQQILATPTGKVAAKRAARLSQDEGIPFDANSVRGVDLIKRTLDDVISEGYRTGRNNEARIIKNLRDKLVTAVDDHVPEFAMARDVFAGESAIKDALAAGRALFKDAITPQEIGDQLVRMTTGEREAFIQGARASIQTVMGTARNDAAAVRTLFQKGFNREKLEIVLGSQEADRLLKHVGFETTAANTAQRVVGNSETAARVAGREDLTPGNNKGLGIRDSYAAGGTLGAIRGAGLKLVDKAIDAVRAGRQKDIEAAVADILTMRGQDRDKAVAAVMREALRQDRSGTLARHVRSLATAGVLAGSPPHVPAIAAAGLNLLGVERSP